MNEEFKLKTCNQFISIGIFTALSIIVIACTSRNAYSQVEKNVEQPCESNSVIAAQVGSGSELDVVSSQGFNLPPVINLVQYSDFASGYHPVRYVRVWGWSKNGKIAYSIEGGLNSEASYQINFAVLDLVTNNESFNLTILIDIYPGSADDWAEVFFEEHRADIVNALITHEIIEQQTDFLPFPMLRNNNLYYAQITDTEHGEDEKWLLGDTILRYSLSVAANDRKKIIGTFKPFLWLADVDVCGYFLSPFENIILIVIAEDLGLYQHGGILYRFIGFQLGEILD